MHKNQQNDSADGINEIKKVICSEYLNSLSCDDAMAKTYFFHRLISIIDIPAIYLDFDLLYSGYVGSKILPNVGNVELHQPNPQTWKDLCVDIVEKISKKQHLVIIDSLNGFFSTLLNQKNSGRTINNTIMLFVNVGQKTNSIILVGSVSKFKKDEGWVLSALGRHVLKIDRMNQLSLKKENSHLRLVSSDQRNMEKLSISISDLDMNSKN